MRRGEMSGMSQEARRRGGEEERRRGGEGRRNMGI
jgi:hypothetical protein